MANEVEVGPIGQQYRTVAAGQTAQVLGVAGKTGDYLESVVIVVATAATATVSIKDGGDTAINVFPNNPGGGVGTYTVPLGLRSRTGAWQITTGAGSSVIAVGKFS
jgi:hypothetical protein